MPLIVRYVEPQALSKTPLLQGDLPRENELERMTVASLTATIRQLSSLAKHAESIMGDIADALSLCYSRSRALEERVRRLKVDVVPSLSDEVLSELKILPSERHFQSDKKIDQQLLCIQRATPALQHQYHAAAKVPPLDLLTPHRDDGARASKLYSDPDFFFENWRQNQLLENATPKSKLKKQHSSGRWEREHHVPSKTAARQRGGHDKIRRAMTLDRSSAASRRRLTWFGGSEQRVQAGWFRSGNASGVSKATSRKPAEHFHMMTNLSKVQAEVYMSPASLAAIDPGVNSKPPARAAQKQPSFKADDGYLKRSFSLRKPKTDSKSGHGKRKFGTVRGGSRLLEEGCAAWNTYQEGRSDPTLQMYAGLSQQHMEALGLDASDIPSPLPSPSLFPTTLPKEKVVADGTVTFRASKSTRERPMSLLLQEWNRCHSPTMNRMSKRLQALGSVLNSEVASSTVDLRTSSPALSSTLCSALSSSCATPEGPKGIPTLTALSKREGMQGKKEDPVWGKAGSGPQGDNIASGPQGDITSGLWGNIASGPQGDIASGPWRDNTASGPRGDNITSGPRGDNTASGPQGDNTASGPRGDNTASGPRGDNTASGPQDNTTFLGDNTKSTGREEGAHKLLGSEAVSEPSSGHSIQGVGAGPMAAGKDTRGGVRRGVVCTEDSKCAQEDQDLLMGSLSTVTLGDVSSKEGEKALGQGSLMWQSSPFFADCQGPSNSGNMHAKSEESQAISGYNCDSTLHEPDCGGPQGGPIDGGGRGAVNLTDPKALQSSQAQLGTPNSGHCQAFEASDLNSQHHPLDKSMKPYSHTLPFGKQPLPSQQQIETTPLAVYTQSTFYTHHLTTPTPSAITFTLSQALARTLVCAVDVGHSHNTKPLVPPNSKELDPQAACRHAEGQHPSKPSSPQPPVAGRATEAGMERQGLLEAIRAGIQLKKVACREKTKLDDARVLPWDVAAILERRVALGSKSESDSSDADSEWEEGGW